MKILTPLLIAIALAFTACDRRSTAETDKRNDGTALAQAATDRWTELRTYTYEKRGDFSSSLNAVAARIEAEVSQLEADASAARASQARKDAIAAVKSNKAKFDEKTAALVRATQETWNQARDEAAAAWDQLQASLAKARAEP